MENELRELFGGLSRELKIQIIAMLLSDKERFAEEDKTMMQEEKMAG